MNARPATRRPAAQPDITRIEPDDPALVPLIRAHLEHSWTATPQTSNHTLDAAGLTAPDLRIWAAHLSGSVVGCGALKTRAGAAMAEVKSVHVAKSARGRGVARAIMLHLIAVARSEAIQQLVLETGTMDAYAAARRLYEGLGFSCCGPIPGYGPDPNSAFMQLDLSDQP